MNTLQMGEEKGAIEVAKEQRNALEQHLQEQKESYKKKLKKVRRKVKRYKKRCRKLKKQNRMLKEQLGISREREKKNKKKAKDYKRVIRRERYASGENPFIDIKAALKDSKRSEKKKAKKCQRSLALLDEPRNENLLLYEQMLRFMTRAFKQQAIDGEFRECEEEDKR